MAFLKHILIYVCGVIATTLCALSDVEVTIPPTQQHTISDDGLIFVVEKDSLLNIQTTVVNGDSSTALMLTTGDGTAILTCNGSLETTHTYTTAGLYNMIGYAYNDLNILSQNNEVYALQLLNEEMFDYTIEEPWLGQLQKGTVDFLRDTSDKKFWFTACNVSVNGDLIFTTERETPGSTPDTSFNHTPAVLSTIEFHINCSNYISEVGISVSFTVQQPLENVTLKLVDYIQPHPGQPDRNLMSFKKDDVLTLQLSYVGGSSGFYELDIYDPFVYYHIMQHGLEADVITLNLDDVGVFFVRGKLQTTLGQPDVNLSVYWDQTVFSSPGIHVYDFCETCFRLVRVTTNALLFEGIDTSIDYKVEVTSLTDTESPQDVWIDWEVTNESSIENPDYASRVNTTTNSIFSQTLHLTHSPNFTTRTVNVTCNTPLGQYLMQEEIYFIKALTGCTITIVKHEEMSNVQTIFQIELHEAEKFVKYIIDFGDNTLTEERNITDYIGPVQHTHTYKEAGMFSVSIDAFQVDDLTSAVADSISVKVLNPVDNLLLYINGRLYDHLSTLYLIFPDKMQANLSVVPGVESNLPSDVTCRVDFGDFVSDTQVVGDFLQTTDVKFQHTYSSENGTLTLNITCSNPVNSQIFVLDISVSDVLEAVSINVTDEKYLGRTDEEFLFDVSVTGGEDGGQLAILYGDGHSDMLCLANSSEAAVNFSYQEPEVYIVTVMAWDISGVVTGQISQAINIQRPITPDVSYILYGTPKVYYQSSKNHKMSFSQLDTSPASDVTCNFTYSPTTTKTIVISNHTHWLVEENVTFVEYNYNDHDETLIQKHMKIDFFCWNLVSNHSDTYPLELFRFSQNLTIDPVNDDQYFILEANEEMMVICLGNGSPCFVPQNRVLFEIFCLYGVDGFYEFENLGPVAQVTKFAYNGSGEGNMTHYKYIDFTTYLGPLEVTIKSMEILDNDSSFVRVTRDKTPIIVMHSIRKAMVNFTIDGPTTAVVPSEKLETFTFESNVVIDWDDLNFTASCHWIFPNDSEVFVFNPKVKSSIDIHIEPKDGLVQTVKVQCSNYVSIYNWTHHIAVQRRIVDLSISLVSNFGYYTRSFSKFRISGLYGESAVTYHVFANDSLEYVNSKPKHEDHQVSFLLTAGIYEVGCTVTDTVGNTTCDTITIIVQQDISQLHTKVEEYGTIPPGNILLRMIGVAPYPMQELPTDIECTLNLTGHPIFTIFNIFGDQCTMSTPDSVERSYVWLYDSNTIVIYLKINVTLDNTLQPATEYTALTICGNHVSSRDDTLRYHMEYLITGFECKADKYVAEVGEDVTFTLSRDSGTSVTYKIEFWNSTSVDFESGAIYIGNIPQPQQIVESFMEGFYNVTCLAFNDAQESSVLLSPVNEIEVQKAVKYVTFEPVDTETDANHDFPHVYYVDMTVSYDVDISNKTYGLPYTVYYEVSFGDGQTETIKRDTSAATDVKLVLTHSYGRDYLGQVETDLRVYNNISEQTGLLNVTLMEKISGCTLTKERGIATMNEVMTFFIQCQYGSHISLQIDFDETNSSDTQYDDFDLADKLDMAVVQDREKQYQHSYLNPGNYSIRVNMSNLLTPNFELPPVNVTIRAELLDIKLHHNGPILTPPGLMMFNLTTATGVAHTAHDVRCVFVYDDGFMDAYYYHPDMTFPLLDFYNHTYFPNKQTIKSSLTVDVTCSNVVSQKQTNEKIEIIANPVVLGKLVNNGPVMLGDDFIWNLTIHQYGEDTCFLWTFTSLSHSVLFGREDCKTKPNMNSFDEYIDIPTEIYFISHVINASVGPVFEVSILAENSISSESITKAGLALEKPCDPATMYIADEGTSADNPRQIHFAVVNTIYGVAITKCSYPYKYHIDWKIYEYNQTQFTDKGARLPMTFLSKADLNLESRSVPLGLYVVEMTTTMTGLPVDIISYDTMYLEVIHTPLIVLIAGGIERIVSVSETSIIIDGVTLSEDPDLNDISDKSNMTWKWLCQTNVSNHLPSGYNWTDNSGLDPGNCNIPSLQQFPNPGTLTLATADLIPGPDYVFTVFISKPDGRDGIHSQTLHSQNTQVLDVTLECKINCREYINADDNVRFLGKCSTCNTNGWTFVWQYQIYDKNLMTFSDVTLPLDPYVITDETEIAIDFPPKTFSQGETYRLKLIVSQTNAMGSSSEELKINSAPRDGFCEPKSLEGDENGRIRVRVTCEAWRDDEEEALAGVIRKRRSLNMDNAPNLDFEVSVILNYLEIGRILLLGQGRSPETPPTYLPAGDPSDNNSVPIRVSITDSFGTAANTLISVENGLLENVTENVLYGYMRDLRRTADAGDIQTTSALLWTVLSLHETGSLPLELNATEDMLGELYSLQESQLYPWGSNATSDENHVLQINTKSSENVTVDVDSFYILQLAKLEPEFPNEIKQITGLLAYLAGQFDELPYDIDLAKVSEMVNEMMQPFQNYIDHFTVSEKLDTIRDSLVALGSALNVASKKKHKELIRVCTSEECPPNILEDFNKTLATLELNTTSVINILSDLCLLHTLPEEPPVVIDTPHIVMSSQRVKESTLPGYTVQTRLGHIRLPYNLSVYENVTSDDYDVTFWVFEQNPYLWHPGAYYLNGPTNQIRVTNRLTGEPQILLDTSYEDPFISTSFVENTPETLFIQANNTATDLVFHTFWMNDTSLTAKLFFDIHRLKDVTLKLYISYDDEPNINNYDFATVLPKGMPEDVPTDREERLVLLGNATDNFNSSLYSFIIPKDVTVEIGLYTVAVLIIPFDAAGLALDTANYTFYVQYSVCSLWFDEEEMWIDQDCQVSGNTTFVAIVIISRVFPSSFGSGLFVPPNTISFGTVFDDSLTKLKENIHVIVTVLLFIFAYLSILPVAYRKDRLDVKNWTPLPVVGVPIPEDYHRYMIDVYTGFGTHDGTESNVYITLVGEHSETEAIHLHTPNRKNFVKGQMNRFVIGSRMDLGKLYYIHIWHDSTGKAGKADWYLDHVIVTSVPTNTRQVLHFRVACKNKRYLFLCEDWLSLNKGNQKTDRLLKLASKYDVVQVKRMFQKRAKSLFLEGNLWISTFTKREVDSFTRVERITAAIAIVFLAMVSNAMWYGRGDSDSPKDVMQFGPFSFTLRSVMVSLYSVLTIVPVSLLIVLFFKKSKPRVDYSKFQEPEKKQKVSESTQTSPQTPPPPYSLTERQNTDSNLGRQETSLHRYPKSENIGKNPHADSNSGNRRQDPDVESNSENIGQNPHVDSNCENIGQNPDTDPNSDNRGQGTSNNSLTDTDPNSDNRGQGTYDNSMLDADLNSNNSNNNRAEDTYESGLSERPQENHKTVLQKFSGKIFPFWFAYIAFAVCNVSVILSAFFTVSYSFEWGGEKSAQWLGAFALCFFETEGLFSPLKAVFLALILAVICKKPQDQSDEYLSEEESFHFRTDEEGDEKLLQERLEKMRFRKWLENTLREAFKVLIWHSLFLLSLGLVVSGNADSNSFGVNEDLVSSYFKPATEISSQADFWDYMKHSAVPDLFMEESYNGKKSPEEQNQFLGNRYSKKLGAPGLRQFRVKKSDCSEIKGLSTVRCIDDYSRSHEEKRTFREHWILPQANVSYTPSTTLQKAFQYDRSDKTNFIYRGYYTEYYGRGYSVPLGTNKAETERLVEELISSRWIDHNTRAVTLEFNVYNANINLFTLVSLVVEFPSVGSVLLKHEIKSVKLYRYIGGFGVFALIAESIVFVFIVVLGVRMIYQAVKEGRKYFTKLLNLSEVLKICFGIGAILTYTTRTILIQKTVTRLLNNKDEFANFRNVILVDEMFLSFIGFTLFIQILQLLWVFKFNKSLAHLSGTLKYSMEDVKGFLLAFSGIFIGFAILYHDTYGNLLWDYRNFLQTFYSNLSSILGHFRTAEYEEVAGLSGRLLFIGFMGSSVFFYMNMLISMITLFYGQVKSGDLDIGQEYKVGDLISEKLAGNKIKTSD